MDIWIFVILSVLLIWIIFYKFYAAKWKAASDRIKSKPLRNAVKVFLKLSYVVSFVAIVLGWVFSIVSVFSNKGNKS
jgi:ABC-type sulfate transport system permease component